MLDKMKQNYSHNGKTSQHICHIYPWVSLYCFHDAIEIVTTSQRYNKKPNFHQYEGRL